MRARTVRVQPPSFPAAAVDQRLAVEDGVRWQVLCGDASVAFTRCSGRAVPLAVPEERVGRPRASHRRRR
jgi:hypothetical protein